VTPNKHEENKAPISELDKLRIKGARDADESGLSGWTAYNQGFKAASTLEVLVLHPEIKNLLSFYFKDHDKEWIETSVGGGYQHMDECRKCEALSPRQDALEKTKGPPDLDHKHKWKNYKDDKNMEYCETTGCGIDRKKK